MEKRPRSHLPYSFGISRHEPVVRTTDRMPLNTVRWSWRGRPVVGFRRGSTGRTRSHPASVSPACIEVSKSVMHVGGSLSRLQA